jgi:tRNA (mo5U34)-methyltransferase
MQREEVERRISELGRWFHNMELCGVRTAPDHFLGDYPAAKWQRIQPALPRDLSGKTVLDIGCNAGYHSIQMKRRGAAKVVGIDSDPGYLSQARFAAEVNEADIEFLRMDVYDVAQLGERFDLVLFMGVMYHLRHPLLALDLLHQHVVKETLVFQSLMRGPDIVASVLADYPFSETGVFDTPGYPVLYFVERRYAGDQTNWWIPNRACVEAMLRSSGFEITDRPEGDVYICQRRPARG